MLPQISGPGTFTTSPLAQVRAEQGAARHGGETAAAAPRPSLTDGVDPPRALPATARAPEDRRRETLLPPDPDPPTGPPPAFDATPLDRAREVAMHPPQQPASLSPMRGTDAPERRGASPSGEGLRQKAEAEVALVRRIAEPRLDPGVDVTL